MGLFITTVQFTNLVNVWKTSGQPDDQRVKEVGFKVLSCVVSADLNLHNLMVYTSSLHQL